MTDQNEAELHSLILFFVYHIGMVYVPAREEEHSCYTLIIVLQHHPMMRSFKR